MKYLEEISKIAAMAEPRGRYFDVLKLCEKGIPDRLQVPWRAMRDELQASNVVRSEAATSFSPLLSRASLLGGILLALLAAIAALLNLLPLGGAYLAGKKFPDARNVITLWRILVGVPLFFLWFVAMVAGLVLAGEGQWIVFFLSMTVIGWLSYRPARQLLIAGWNGTRFPGLRRRYLEFREALLEEMGHHGP
jgi:hypothetical protein